MTVAIVSVYLGAISIDDGLEALAFLPIIGGVSVVGAAPAGWRQASLCWPMLAAMAVVGTSAGLVWLVPPPHYSRGLAHLVLAGGPFFAIPGGYFGYVVGRMARWRYEVFKRACARS